MAELGMIGAWGGGGSKVTPSERTNGGAVPTNTAVPNSAEIIKALQGMQPKSPAAAMPAYPTTSEPLTNTASPNATIEGIIKTLGERAKGGMGVPEALRLSEAAQRRDTSGRIKEQQQLAARNGQLGSGAQVLGQSNIQQEGQRDMANSADQIAYRGEQDRNALYGQIVGHAAQSEGLQGNQQQLGLAQWSAQQAATNNKYNAVANTALQQQQIDNQAETNLFSKLMQLF